MGLRTKWTTRQRRKDTRHLSNRTQQRGVRSVTKKPTYHHTNTREKETVTKTTSATHLQCATTGREKRTNLDFPIQVSRDTTQKTTTTTSVPGQQSPMRATRGLAIGKAALWLFKTQSLRKDATHGDADDRHTCFCSVFVRFPGLFGSVCAGRDTVQVWVWLVVSMSLTLLPFQRLLCRRGREACVCALVAFALFGLRWEWVCFLFVVLAGFRCRVWLRRARDPHIHPTGLPAVEYRCINAETPSPPPCIAWT